MASQQTPEPVARRPAGRSLQVLRTARITPRMARITLGGDGLCGFPGGGPDQRIKMFFPAPGQRSPAMPRSYSGGPVWPPGEPRPAIRTYTVRRFDPGHGDGDGDGDEPRRGPELDVDFVLHEGAGPAAGWAERAVPGDQVGVSDPGGRYRPDPASSAHLLVGDESALPAIATILQAMPPGAPVEVLVEVADSAEEQPLPTAARATVHWLHRGGEPAGANPLLADAVRGLELPAGGCQAWVSSEAAAVQEIRAHLLGERGIDRHLLYATGYWRRAGARH